jgi:hypothetical protein
MDYLSGLGLLLGVPDKRGRELGGGWQFLGLGLML